MNDHKHKYINSHINFITFSSSTNKSIDSMSGGLTELLMRLLVSQSLASKSITSAPAA